MPNSSFIKRHLRVSLTLAKGAFGETVDGSPLNTTIKQDLRIECEIEKSGHPSKNMCKLKIYGMPQEDMNRLTMVVTERPLSVRRNLVKVEAFDDSTLSSPAIAFTGEITSAYAKYNRPPDLYFEVEAIEGYYPSVKPVSPKSYKGGSSVASMMLDLANQMGCEFENNGVTTQLSNQYLSGTAFQQAAKIAHAANIEFGIDNNTLFIAPRGASRRAMTTVPLISAATGMKEYPTFDKKGLRVETLYNPNIQLGGLVAVESVVLKATTNRAWRVHSLHHHLSCELPNGPWYSKIEASYVGS